MFLAVDKPTRITSFGIIRRLKKQYSGQKIGHSGTLDPLATGLMILAIGKDTKRLTEIIGKDKSYIATIDFSVLSDTWDIDYWEEITNYELRITNDIIQGIKKDDKLIPAPPIEAIEQLLSGLIPLAELPLPNFSAKKKDGKRMYDLARKGTAVQESRPMKVLSFTILDYSFPLLTLRLEVGSGTYIRSIAYRLGQELGLGGCLRALRRTSIGAIDLENIDFYDIPDTPLRVADITELMG